MSLGSRITTRGSARAAVNASQTLISTPREPLLFLYPQWARRSSSAAPAPKATPEPTGRNENTRENVGYTGEKSIRPRVNRGSWLLLGTSEGENVFKARRYAAANRVAGLKCTPEEENRRRSDGVEDPMYAAFTRPGEFARDGTERSLARRRSVARTIADSAKEGENRSRGLEHWGIKSLPVGSKSRTVHRPAASTKDGKSSRWVVIGGRLAKRTVLPRADRLQGTVAVAEKEKSLREVIVTGGSAKIDPLSAAKSRPTPVVTRNGQSSKGSPTTMEKDLYANTFQYPTSSPNLPPATHSNYEALSAEVMLSKATRVEDPSTMLKDVERSVRLINRVAQRTQVSELSARDIREEFYDYRRQLTDNWVPDWRIILDDMKKKTISSHHWHERQLQIVVPPESAQLLTTGLDTFIWDIGQNYGCSIALGREDGIMKSPRTFIVSGSRAAISRTVVDVVRIAPEAKVMRANLSALHAPEETQLALAAAPETPTLRPELAPSEALETLDLRPVLASARRINVYKHPDDVRKPSTWTEQSLLDYICSFTNNFAAGKHHPASIDTLSKLFMDPEPDLGAAITRTACHEALQYFVAANRVVDVRALFVRMELLRLPLSTETFNIMLRGAAKHKDLHNFHFILHLMLKRGFLANGYTWIALLMALDDFQVKLHVAISMKQTGLLTHKSIIKGVCEQLIQAEVEVSINAHQTQEAFVAHMDARYGRAWLSLTGGNLVLDVLGSRGMIARCWDFLHFMDSRFIRPNDYSINTILNHCKQTCNLLGAVKLMENVHPSWGFRPNKETFRILFDLAWLTRSFNVAKVIWKYACMAGLLPQETRHRVRTSLQDVWKMPHNPKFRWDYYAGSVIFGAYCGLHPLRSVDDRAVIGRLDPEEREGMLASMMDISSMVSRHESGIGPFPPNPEPLYQPLPFEELSDTKLLRRAVDDYSERIMRELRYDLHLSEHMDRFTAKLSFTEMLTAAWNLDCRWREDGTYRHARLRRLMAQAIQVPLEVNGTEDVVLL